MGKNEIFGGNDKLNYIKSMFLVRTDNYNNFIKGKMPADCHISPTITTVGKEIVVRCCSAASRSEQLVLSYAFAHFGRGEVTLK